MAFKHGKNAAVWFNGADVSTILTSAGIEVSAGTSDVTTFKSGGWKKYIPGLVEATFPFDGLYEPDDDTLVDALGVDAGVLTYCPAGDGTVGDLARLASITTTGYAEGSTKDEATTIAWSAMAEDTVHFGYVLHPFGEDTNTTTGATRDDGASTDTGWTAHLHVSLVDGGSWVVKMQDASASNFSDGADVTGGEFTAATGVTSQRLQSAAGATLRRYVRYVATRTGGSAGHGMTFGLALARTR